MKLTAIGVYGPFPKAKCGTSSYLLTARGRNILLDVGEGSFSRLSAIIPPEKTDVIFISHSHFDHIADLGIFNYYFESLSKKGKSFDKPYIIYYDDGNPSLAFLKNSPYFTSVALTDGGTFKKWGLTFDFLKVRHPAVTHAVTVFDGEKRFTYTGDTNDCENLSVIYEKSDAVLADGCFMPEDWTADKPHLSIDIIKEYSEKFSVRTIVGHLNPDYDGDFIKGEVEKRGLILAEEGKGFEI